MDPQALYVQLGNLVAEMPYLGGTGPITPEMNRWLGRAAILVEAAGMSVDLASLRLASNTLTVARDLNAQTIQAIVFRALALAEANAPGQRAALLSAWAQPSMPYRLLPRCLQRSRGAS